MNATAKGGAASTAPSARGWTAAAAGHGHAAVLYDDTDVLLTATTPFLEDGLRAGDLVVLACPPEVAATITGPLGERARHVESEPRICLLDTRAPDAFGATRQVLQRAPAARSGRVRLVGQVQFGCEPATYREGLRYEIAANAVLAGAPMSVLCLLDATVLPAPLLSLAAAAHPQLVAGDGLVDNRDFREPSSFLHSLPVPHEPVEDTEPLLAVEGATVLSELRRRLRTALATAVPDPDQQDDLVLAVSEVAANAFRHGRPPVSARLWADDCRLVCTVTDSGRGYDDPLAGFQPAHGDDLAHGGMGLWLARKLWDSVDLVNDGPGLTVRLATALCAAAA
ncbi:anti-sigma factor RsbA family regulatory protein [Trujillonella humicola]|uniref:anti-sigma factor RsbA family regulatory protein n=1 Tax=Trujillonella humicola TaxID=3383699 RepID=UPI003905AAB3